MRSSLAGTLFTLLSGVVSSVALVICSSVLFVSCGNDKDADAGARAALADTAHYTVIAWQDSLSRNYGTIIEGEKLNVTYRFRNIGNTPLVIGRVRPSCGCTVAEKPQKPIAPGEEGEIRATFNSENHVGINHKTLFVDANTKGIQNYSLQFVVQVDKKPS